MSWNTIKVCDAPLHDEMNDFMSLQCTLCKYCYQKAHNQDNNNSYHVETQCQLHTWLRLRDQFNDCTDTVCLFYSGRHFGLMEEFQLCGTKELKQAKLFMSQALCITGSRQQHTAHLIATTDVSCIGIFVKTFTMSRFWLLQ